jgi:2-polyprenyl-6-methoxyphenol hydroxylase-like FAD-dependent oxidoreductase
MWRCSTCYDFSYVQFQPCVCFTLLSSFIVDIANTCSSDRGQGANNALYDSYCFVEAIKTVVNDNIPLEKAINDYDEKVLKRGMEEVQISKSQTFFTHDWEHLVNSPVMKLGTKPSHGAKTEGYK